MLDEILGGLFARFLVAIVCIILFPVAVIICTPFILIRASVLAMRHRQRFVHAVQDGYSSLWVFWWT
jgi:hypothetical protein